MVRNPKIVEETKRNISTHAVPELDVAPISVHEPQKLGGFSVELADKTADR